ncbi:hypothetical protein GCM10009111_02410 [Colwellia asteriadis]|uniref:DUF4268 domain-containing protein n=1 Tax=Colwellia asteriadis TaxID=517723 RepID=A0ABN1L2K8_9GAMM
MNTNTTPLLINKNKIIEKLNRIDFADSSVYDEKWLQTIIFENTDLLPIHEINPDYTDLVPICMELQSSSGRIDCLYVTTAGRIIIVEVKLYRNPQSRREVVGQTLDYAKDLNKWSYTELDNQVKRRTGDVSLYECVKAHCNDLPEAYFIDAVQKSLSGGKFLLMVVGDGIREGANEINDFLTRNASLEFSFAMVEMMIFKMENDSLLVQPRLLQKTEIVERHVISIENANISVAANLSEDVAIDRLESNSNNQPTEDQILNQEYWSQFLSELKLDDSAQPICNTSKQSSISMSLPPSGMIAWVTLYKDKKSDSIGVFIRFVNNDKGRYFYHELARLKNKLDVRVNDKLSWNDDERRISITPLNINYMEQYNRHKVFEYYSSNLNLLINTFRPLLLRLSKE